MYVHKGLGYIYTQIMMKHGSWTTHADPVYDFPSSSMCMAKTDVRANKDDEKHMHEIKKQGILPRTSAAQRAGDVSSRHLAEIATHPREY